MIGTTPIYFILACILTGTAAGIVIVYILTAAVYGEWWVKFALFIAGWIAVFVLWRFGI